jgi:hypothetical protein
MSREPFDDFEPVAEWLRSEQPPFSEEDRAAMRQGVWREIGARAGLEGTSRPGRLVFAGAAVLAAVLVAVLWVRPVATAPVVATDATATKNSASVTESAQPPPVEEYPPLPAPGHVRPRVHPRRAEPEGVPVRIEFQTANPEVRIIWLVKKGEAMPRPGFTGRKEETS